MVYPHFGGLSPMIINQYEPLGGVSSTMGPTQQFLVTHDRRWSIHPTSYTGVLVRSMMMTRCGHDACGLVAPSSGVSKAFLQNPFPRNDLWQVWSMYFPNSHRGAVLLDEREVMIFGVLLHAHLATGYNWLLSMVTQTLFSASRVEGFVQSTYRVDGQPY